MLLLCYRIDGRISARVFSVLIILILHISDVRERIIAVLCLPMIIHFRYCGTAEPFASNMFAWRVSSRFCCFML